MKNTLKIALLLGMTLTMTPKAEASPFLLAPLAPVVVLVVCPVMYTIEGIRVGVTKTWDFFTGKEEEPCPPGLKRDWRGRLVRDHDYYKNDNKKKKK